MTPKKRVLLVDDSPLVRHALSRRITSLGCEVLQADGHDQAQAVDPSTLDAVVMDLELGAADGTETARRFLDTNPTLRVAFFTSGSSAAILERARALGPVFSKPDEIDRLLEWLRS